MAWSLEPCEYRNLNPSAGKISASMDRQRHGFDRKPSGATAGSLPEHTSSTPHCQTVDGAGIEPATHGFSVRCSTN